MTDCNKTQANNLACNKISLTEQWKKGELPEGEKYIELRDGRIFTAHFNGKEFREVYNSDIKEILAEVPTFDEWKASEKYNKHLEEVIKIYERKEKQHTDDAIAYNELAEENTKLKTENKWYSEQLNEAVKKIDKLKEQINKYILDSINRGTANAVKAVKEFGMPERIEELVKQNTKLKTDCKTLAQKLLQVKPELREWLEVNYGEYL